MKTSEAVQLFRNGFNCAQAVASVFALDFNMEEDSMRRLACGFGGGIGGMQNVCGAASGAFMVLGLEFGYSKESEKSKKQQMYDIIKDFSEEFSQRNGYLNCCDLLGCDLNSQDGKDYFKSNNLRENVCVKCVRNSVELLEHFLKNTKE